MLSRRFKNHIFVLVIFIILQQQYALASTLSENELKTGYIYNFITYTQWPDELNDEINLCVFGDNSIIKALYEIEGEKVASRTLNIKNNINMASLAICHVVFISHTKQNELTKIVKKTSKQPVLTITDVPQGMHQGVIITMLIRKKKIKFQINNRIAKQYALNISSRLLSLAVKVK